MDQTSSDSTDPELVRRIMSLARHALAGFTPGVALVSGQGAWRLAESDLAESDLNAPAALIQTAIDRAEALWLADCAAEPNVGCFIAAPVVSPGGAIQAVIFGYSHGPHAFDRCVADALDDLAALFRVTLASLARTDSLNGVIATLDDREHKLNIFANLTPISNVMTDRDMRVMKATGQWLINRRMSEEQVIGRSVFEIVPGYEVYREIYREVIASGKAYKDDKVRWQLHGRMLWMQLIVIPWFDRDGQVGGVHIAAHDVTELVEAMERIHRSEARLKLALEMADMHVFELDLARGVLEKAGVEDRFFDRPQTIDDISADNLSAVHPEDRERVGALLAEHLEQGTPFSAEFRVNREGPEVWAASVSQIDRDEHGKIARFMAAMQDITPRKANEIALLQAKEAAESANRAKSTFLATMSHEIRTPLNGVLGMAQAMASDALSPLQRDRLDVVRQSGETLLAILNDVLDLSKIEAGKLELEEIEFDISELSQGAYAAFTAIANKKGLSFDLMVEKNARGIYRGDSTRIRQIIYNLVSNGLKFTEHGEVRVVISRIDGELCIQVRDTGIGIPAERLAHLFQKFEQADASTTRQFGGTGLGLAICRELASLMGGAITATSEAGKGTVFQVQLPITRISTSTRRAARMLAAAAPKAPEPVADGGTLRVLAAEDNLVNQLVLTTLLHQIGVDPTVVDNGEDAVAAWENESWDLIFMDVQMPRMDGPTATRRIRELEATLGRARTPIIALTANAMSHHVAEYVACGMDGFVAKPIEIGCLFAALRGALGKNDESETAMVA